MKKILLFVAVIGIAASCQKDNLSPEVSPVAEMVTISATQEPQVSTRTSLSSDSTVLWIEGDSFAVYGSEALTSRKVYTLAEGAGTAEGRFSGENVAGNRIAVYPASSVASDAVVVFSDGMYNIPVNVPSVQTYVEGGGFSNEANLAFAVGSEGLAFRNLMSVLKIKVYGTTARNITRLQLAASEPLCGPATVRFDEDGNDAELVFDENAGHVITLNVSGVNLGTEEDAPSVFYFVVPTASFANGFTISIENTAANDTFYALARTTTDNTTSRSMITEMDTKSVSFTVTKSALANTLIVEPSCEVSIFPLQPVTGNLLCHHKNINGLGYSKAETKGEYTNYTSGYAKYTATDTKGYYVCAMKDFNGDIQWSWTIWTTETPDDLALTNGFVIMDRNLGAMAGQRAEDVTAADLRGLYYQWGRKDPLFNYKSNAIACSAEVGTVEYVTRNPLAYIIPAEGSEYPNDWLWKGNSKLWGKTKTEYDPCPAGYRVPDGNTDTLSFWVGCDFVGKAGKYDDTLKGYDFNVLEDGSPLFLVGGCVSYDSASAAPTLYANGYYWCSNTVTYTTNNNHYGRVYSFKSTTAPAKGGLAKYYGAQIRCQKIQ